MCTFAQKPKTATEIQKDDARPNMGKIDASTTSTALMALCLGDKLSLFYDRKKTDPSLQSTVGLLYGEKWTSVGLNDLNFFTAALVFRALGFLVERDRSLKGAFSGEHQGKSYDALITLFGGTNPSERRVGGDTESDYPLTPTLGYWIMDAAERLSWRLEPQAWICWAEWAANQFQRQLSAVTEHDDASMDPVALAMAACLVAKIRRIAASGQVEAARRDVERALPSREQLRAVLPELFTRQGESGIWPKYFPLFVYPKGGAVNHCFAFELMEALLNEFPEELVGAHLDGVARAVEWCETRRVHGYLHKGDAREYSGWNSGANLDGLREGNPECWATAVVHMFLCKLEEVLGRTIQERILRQYGATEPKGSPEARLADWRSLVSSDVRIVTEETTVSAVLEEIARGWSSLDKKNRKRSALLFGPPGTSKTNFVKKLAHAHGWPCVAIDPSHFLSDGMEKIYARTDEIFRDLEDLSDAVVFFDEMDPLVQQREEHLDFFMATNHFRWFDSAIKRPGRFDYLLFVGPPTWQKKVLDLARGGRAWESLGFQDDPARRDTAAQLLRDWTEHDAATREALDRFTIGEVQALFDGIRKGGDLLDSLRALGRARFIEQVTLWSEKHIVLWKRADASSAACDEYELDRDQSRRQ
jgi:hypothetical protein